MCRMTEQQQTILLKRKITSPIHDFYYHCIFSFFIIIVLELFRIIKEESTYAWKSHTTSSFNDFLDANLRDYLCDRRAYDLHGSTAGATKHVWVRCAWTVSRISRGW